MSCQFLSGRQIKMCAAFEGSLVLSVGELDCCTTPRYLQCRIFKKATKDGGKLPLQEYRQKYVLPSV